MYCVGRSRYIITYEPRIQIEQQYVAGDSKNAMYK